MKTLTRSFPSALIQAKDSNGRPILEGKRVTGLSNAEEEAHGLDIVVSGWS